MVELTFQNSTILVYFYYIKKVNNCPLGKSSLNSTTYLFWIKKTSKRKILNV